MDGNGRWAKSRGLSRIKGHEAGAQAVRECVEGCGELKVEYLTLYAFSAENWQRPRAEIIALMRLLEKFLKEKTPELLEKNVRLQAIGRLTDLPHERPGTTSQKYRANFRQHWSHPHPGAQLRRPTRDYRRHQKFASRNRTGSHRQGDDRCEDVQQASLHALLSRSRPSYPHVRRNAALEFSALANFLHGDVHHPKAVA